MATPDHKGAQRALEQAIAAERAKLMSAQPCRSACTRSLLYADGEDAVVYAELRTVRNAHGGRRRHTRSVASSSGDGRGRARRDRRTTRRFAMKFTELVTQISGIDGAARLSASQTLQQILSLRNWLIGAYIVEFEQAGEDRAAYGEALVRTLAKRRWLRQAAEVSRGGISITFDKLAFAYPRAESRWAGYQSVAFPTPRIVQTSAQFGDRTVSLRQRSAESASANRQTPGNLRRQPLPEPRPARSRTAALMARRQLDHAVVHHADLFAPARTLPGSMT